MDRAALLAAHETYGKAVATFAETYADANSACEGPGFLGREGVEYFKQFDYMPPPCPSLWYQHEHLIFSSKKGLGVWRGGDTCLSRGDVIQLMNARMPYENGYVFMPMQDAIVTRGSEPLGSHVAMLLMGARRALARYRLWNCAWAILRVGRRTILVM